MTSTASPFSSDSPNAAPIVVRHDVASHRFESTVDGFRSVLDYELDGEIMLITHTFVPPQLRGRGVAEKLVRAALGWAAEQKRRVIPACTYVATFIDRHPEFRRLTV